MLKEPEGPKAPVPKRGIMENLGPSLDRLWSYTCPLTKGHNICCIAWNKVNPVSQKSNIPFSDSRVGFIGRRLRTI